MYPRQENDKILINKPNIGASSNTVVRLMRELSKGHRLYLDNYYTSVTNDIYFENGYWRIINCSTQSNTKRQTVHLPTKNFFKKYLVVFFVEFISSHEGVAFTTTTWKTPKELVFYQLILASTQWRQSQGTIEKLTKKKKLNAQQ